MLVLNMKSYVNWKNLDNNVEDERGIETNGDMKK